MNLNLDEKKRLLEKAFYLPNQLVSLLLLSTMGLFTVSPLMDRTPNLIGVYIYGVLVVLVFKYAFYIIFDIYHRDYLRQQKIFVRYRWVNVVSIVLLMVPIAFYFPQFMFAYSQYGFQDIYSIFSDIGKNYFSKDAVMEEIGANALGIFYTLLNLCSFALVAGFVFLVFYWDNLWKITKIIGLIAVCVQILFFVIIGTMSGLFYLCVFLAAGFMAKRVADHLQGYHTFVEISASFDRIRFSFVTILAIFFILMIGILTSRSVLMTEDQIFYYDQDSLLYRIFYGYVANGIGLATSYVSQGWHGLGNSFELDFEWTYGLSSGRALTEYFYRFFDIHDQPELLAYPFRQEALTGYPALVHWHTIFPWLASDFTFFGAIILTFLFACLYAFVWLNAIACRCPISASFFALLTIGVLFMTANSQILDNKYTFLAFVVFLPLFGFRRFFGKGLR